MQQKPLLAKPRTYGELTLEQHLLDTEEAALSIFKGRILLTWCRFFKVRDSDRFLLHLRIAALFHDIGKANQEFYTASDTNFWGNKQTLRHEWLSALILHLPNVRKWLQQSSLNLDLEIITAAVLSHHLNASSKKWGEPRTRISKIELYLDRAEVTRILEKIAKVADIKANKLPNLPAEWIDRSPNWQQAYQDANDVGSDFGIDIEYDPERRSLLMAVKAGVIAADSVASAMFRVDDSIKQWLGRHLHQESITSTEIEDKILQPRYRQIEEKLKLPPHSFQLKPFQEKAQQQGERLLLLSGCGTGKTIFAYKWMQAIVDRYQIGRVIFLYPTRGTATEGFKDYTAWAPESDASLLTGTASYELKEMRDNPTESTKDKDFTTEARLFALGFWGKRFFSATVDQFLSFLTHSYSGVCLLPVLADSVVVIDEVHSFSRGMFDNLVSFLQHFDIPVLCMTATLPESRQTELLKRVGLPVFSAEDDTELKQLEIRSRYFIEDIKTEDAAFDRAITAYRDQQCILWVVNNVDRCRSFASRLETELGIEVLVYHSRFKLSDRQNRHIDVVKTFAFQKDKRKPAIAVTTQVCEMSLDLDADVVITELAPISSLVQRFGRSNRSSERDSNFRSQIFVYEPPKIKPYSDNDLDLKKNPSKVRQFIADIQGEISPWQLAEKLLQYSPGERYADGNSSFVEGGYWAKSEPFRDTDDYSVNAILRSDL